MGLPGVDSKGLYQTSVVSPSEKMLRISSAYSPFGRPPRMAGSHHSALRL